MMFTLIMNSQIPLTGFTRFPDAATDPVVNCTDPGVTDALEWQNAAFAPVRSKWGNGTIFTERRDNWLARSCTNQTTQYPNVTLFYYFAAYGNNVQDLWDYSTFEFVSNGEDVTIWVFGNADDPKDRWLGTSGLGLKPPFNDTAGYLVRKNNSRLTDKHYFSGTDPCPGDPAFNFNDSYGAYGHYSFNNSPNVWGLPTSVSWNHENYELCYRHNGGYILCNDHIFIKGCSMRPPRVGPFAGWDPNKFTKLMASIICWDTFPPLPPPYHPVITPERGYIYTETGGSQIVSFYCNNLSDTAAYFHIAFTSSLGALIMPPMTYFLLPAYTDSVVQVTVSNIAVNNQKDTITATMTQAKDISMGYTILEGSDPLSLIEIIPDTLVLEIGDTAYIGVYGYSPDNKPLNLNTMNPVWSFSGTFGSIASLADQEHVPEEMHVASFAATSVGSGFAKITAESVSDSIFIQVTNVGLDEKKLNSLISSFPNPFSQYTTIRFTVQTKGMARIIVYDIHGILVRSLFREETSPGNYAITWDGKNDQGQTVGNGIYYCRYETPAGHAITKKIIKLE